MKNFLFILFSICLISFLSCKDKECEKDGTGTINIENLAPQPAEVTVNTDPPFTMAPGENVSLKVPAGGYIITVERDIGGGLIIPTGFSPNVTVCGERNLQIVP